MIPVHAPQKHKTGYLSDDGQDDDLGCGYHDPFGAELHGGFGEAEVGVGRGPGCHKGPDHDLHINYCKLQEQTHGWIPQSLQAERA